MYIGEVSKRSGLSIKAIRFYEEKGLIRRPQRVGRYRTYQESDIEILLLIKEAKELGVTLSRLKGVIVYQDGQIEWQRIKVFLSELREQLLENIAELNTKVAKIDDCYSKIIL